MPNDLRYETAAQVDIFRDFTRPLIVLSPQQAILAIQRENPAILILGRRQNSSPVCVIAIRLSPGHLSQPIADIERVNNAVSIPKVSLRVIVQANNRGTTRRLYIGQPIGCVVPVLVVPHSGEAAATKVIQCVIGVAHDTIAAKHRRGRLLKAIKLVILHPTITKAVDAIEDGDDVSSAIIKIRIVEHSVAVNNLRRQLAGVLL
ncbi:MAG: hypothetical protein DI592_04100, partial [Stenotrophomonas maltophilia]